MQTTLDSFVRVLPKHRCVFCYKTCMSGLDLSCHVQTHTFLSCRQCPAVFLHAKDRDTHDDLHALATRKRSFDNQTSRGTGRTFRCDRCNRNYASQEALDADIAAHAKRAKWTCEHCPDTQFASKDNLRRHVGKKHGSRCKHCNINCTTLESRRDHEALHKDQIYGFLHACEIPHCLVRCATQEQLAFHVQTNHLSSDDEKDTEDKLAVFLQSKNIGFTRDWSNHVTLPLDCRANSARPDFYLNAISQATSKVVLIDNDEHQHKRYTAELERMRNIERALQEDELFKDKPILFIRFNPNGYKVDNVVKTIPLCDAHECLLATIDTCSKQQLQKGLNVVYMYYDTTNGQLDCLQNDKEFATNILTIVT